LADSRFFLKYYFNYLEMRYIRVVTLFFTLAWPGLLAQAQTFSVEQLQRDFQLMQRILEEAHPSLDWYTSRDSLRAHFAHQYAQITQPMTENEAFFAWAPLLVRIRCGHTFLGHSQAFDTQQGMRYWLPMELVCVGKHLYVKRIGKKSCSDSTLQKGAELLEISGHSVAKLLDEAQVYCNTDGYNTTFQSHFLGLYRFEELLFDRYQAKPPYLFKVRNPDGSTSEHSIFRKELPAEPPAPALSEEQKREVAAKALLAQRQFEVLSEAPQTMILRLNGFGYENFKPFHRAAFEAARDQKIQHLIIDLRNNPGGNTENADDILRYLIKAPVDNFKACDGPVKQLSFAQYIEPLPKDQRFNPKELKALPNGQYRRKGTIERLKPDMKRRFDGQIYVLTSGFTFSAGAYFASMLRAHTQAIFIGQETGGGEVGCSGGLISKVILPETKMKMNLPHFRLMFNTDVTNQGRGVMPDHSVTYGPKAWAEQQDLELEKALELIHKNAK
jgi:Peptidase family S41